MREIKFRAWGIERGRMHDVNNIAFHESYGYKAITSELPLNIKSTFMKKEDFILMQYTGLKDKNGVEIFEGGYVVGVQYLTTSPNVPFEIKGVVRYSERNTMFYIDDKENGHDILMRSLGSTLYILEIIGNIYENSDLLEG